MSELRSITILGATGSVGGSTLDLIRRDRQAWDIVALTAHSNVGDLARLAREFGAQLAVIGEEHRLGALREALAGSDVEAAAGAQALCEAAARPADIAVAAIVGCAGLAPVMAAIERGGTVALANKEALVSAGEVMTRAVERHGARLLPVDSEHNAIFQCLAGNSLDDVRWITLTASGVRQNLCERARIPHRPHRRTAKGCRRLTSAPAHQEHSSIASQDETDAAPPGPDRRATSDYGCAKLGPKARFVPALMRSPFSSAAWRDSASMEW